MKRTVHFVKMSAAGNDFVLIDNRRKALPRAVSPVAELLCRRKFCIGADGLLLLEESRKADFRMRYFNSDGSPAAMCGNGARSVARFAFMLGAAPEKMSFETDAGILRAEILRKDVRLHLGEPHGLRIDFPLRPGQRELTASFLDTGVPHTVLFVKDVNSTDVTGLGRMIRHHRAFSPAGTNVDFVQKKDGYTLMVRTYERGVEDETLACGTGVTASAIVAGLKKIVRPPVNCITRGGYILKVSYALNREGDAASPVSNVTLEGPAEVSFTGDVEI